MWVFWGDWFFMAGSFSEVTYAVSEFVYGDQIWLQVFVMAMAFLWMMCALFYIIPFCTDNCCPWCVDGKEGGKETGKYGYKSLMGEEKERGSSKEKAPLLTDDKKPLLDSGG